MAFEITVGNSSKYGVFSGLHFPAFGPNKERHFVSLLIQSGKCMENAGKYGPEKSPHLFNLHAVNASMKIRAT